MNRLPAAACAATLLLAQISAAQADTASSTSLAPVAEPSISEQKPAAKVEDADETDTEAALAARPFADIIAREAKANDVPVELAMRSCRSRAITGSK